MDTTTVTDTAPHPDYFYGTNVCDEQKWHRTFAEAVADLRARSAAYCGGQAQTWGREVWAGDIYAYAYDKGDQVSGVQISTDFGRAVAKALPDGTVEVRAAKNRHTPGAAMSLGDGWETV